MYVNVNCIQNKNTFLSWFFSVWFYKISTFDTLARHFWQIQERGKCKNIHIKNNAVKWKNPKFKFNLCREKVSNLIDKSYLFFYMVLTIFLLSLKNICIQVSITVIFQTSWCWHRSFARFNKRIFFLINLKSFDLFSYLNTDIVQYRYLGLFKKHLILDILHSYIE